MENLETKLVELLDKIEAAGSQLAPEVLGAALTATVFDGVKLAIILAFFVVVGPALIWCATSVKSFRADEVKQFIAAVFGVVMTLFGIVGLLAENPWMAIFAPEAALVKQLLL